MDIILNITNEQLITLAGRAPYERGLDYFNSGRVINWTKKQNSIVGEVEGSEIYRVKLRCNRGGVEGSCDCPASDGIDFCKHCVAVALTCRQEGEQQEKLTEGTSEQRIRAYINKMSKEDIAQHLWELIVDDSHIKQRWSIQADIALNKMDHKAIKKRLTGAIPYNRHLHRYPQVRNYFTKVDLVVDLLQEQSNELEPRRAFELVDYALQRMCRALETVDDSGGFRFHSLGKLHNMHLELLFKLRWDKEKLVNYLLAIDDSDASDLYPEIPSAYEAVLGDQGQDLFFAALQRQWDSLPNLPENAEWDQKYQYLRLQRRLYDRHMAQGDVNAAIAILSKTAIETRDILKICELCIEHDDWHQAELWQARAQKRQSSETPSRWHHDFTLERTQIRILLHKQKYSDALKLQWQIYQKSLVLNDYKTLIELATNCNQAEKTIKDVETHLRSKIASVENQGFIPAYTDALVSTYIHQEKHHKALEVARQYKVSVNILTRLAETFEYEPSIAIPLYKRLADACVARGNNEAYKEAVDLMQKADATIKNSAHQVLFDEAAQELCGKYKAKRNFVKFFKAVFEKAGG